MNGKKFNYNGLGRFKSEKNRLYGKAWVKGIASVEGCFAHCLRVDDIDLRGVGYKASIGRCECYYDEFSDVIDTCDDTYFTECDDNHIGIGGVTFTSGQSAWACYGYD